MINNKVSEEVKQNQDCKVVSPDAERWKKIDELEQQITIYLLDIAFIKPLKKYYLSLQLVVIWFLILKDLKLIMKVLVVKWMHYYYHKLKMII